MTTPPKDIELRDWFAGMAMQCFMNRGLSPTTASREHCPGEGIFELALTRASYRLADAMLAESKKGGE